MPPQSRAMQVASASPIDLMAKYVTAVGEMENQSQTGLWRRNIERRDEPTLVELVSR